MLSTFLFSEMIASRQLLSSMKATFGVHAYVIS